MSNPLVSIIIPCYNAERYVGEAIESALGQTYPDIEVIVVDDGSTDGSLAVIHAYGPSITCLSGKNAGVSAARNKGAAVARGELLQFLDADDLLYPRKLERQVPLAQSHGGIVFCDADVIDMDSNQKLGSWGSTSLGTEDPVVYVLRSVLQTAAPLHSKDRFTAIGGFNDHLSPCEDPDLHLRLACVGVPFYHLREVLYVTRRVRGSLSKQDPGRRLQFQLRVGQDAYEDLQRRGGLTEPRRAAFAGYFAATARRALQYGLAPLAGECFQLARDIHPDGGIPQAYSRGTRLIFSVLGPHATERLTGWKRKLCRTREIG